MAIPSGLGSEVLKNNYQNALSTTARAFFTTTDHNENTEIATVISVVFTECGGNTDTKLNLWIDCGRATISGGADQVINLLSRQPLGARETFVFSDRVVLYGGDALKVSTYTSANVDVVASWIQQDWS